MTHILVIFTGGTIGSSVDNGTIQANSAANFRLITQFQSQSSISSVRFHCLQALEILSENLHPSLWTHLIFTLEAQNLAAYDGIIVTHGTDTLAFTAAALSLYFNQLNKPLLLVSSNYPLEHPQANGLNNFVCAVEFIRQQIQFGVFVAYQNPRQIMQIHWASRLSSCLPLSSDFISVQSKPYMQFVDGRFTQLAAEVKASAVEIPRLSANFSQAVTLIRPYPGLDYTVFNLDQIKVILHDSYHSGTGCSSLDYGSQHSLLAFSRRCQQANVDLYWLAGVKTAATYASMTALWEQNLKMIWNMSLEAAYVKLLLAYNNFTDPSLIQAFIDQDIAFEHVGELYS
jgi:L-asparaginase